MGIKTLGGLVAAPKEKQVVVEALRRGSHVSKIGIIHVDPSDKAAPQARRRALPESIAQDMKAKGLVAINRKTKIEDLEQDDYVPFASRRFRDKADGARVAQNADAEDHPFLNGGASTRDSTAFARAPLANQGQAEIDAAVEAGLSGPGTISEGNRGKDIRDAGDGQDAAFTGEDDDGDDDGADGDDGGEGDADGPDTPPADGEDAASGEGGGASANDGPAAGRAPRGGRGRARAQS